jgi:hypothetical protein
VTLIPSLTTQQLAQTSPLCVIGRIRAYLSEKDRADLDYMLTNPDRYSTRVIARSLTTHGHPVGKDAVHTHRLGGCKCP